MKKKRLERGKKKQGEIVFGNNTNLRGNLITGEVHGNVSYENVETNIQQKGMTEQELLAVRQLLEPLKEKIANSDLPDNKKIMGQEYADQLEKELLKKDGVPDGSVIKVAGNWLLNNIPGIAGTLTDIFVNPVVGKLVEISGQVALEWARQKFGLLRKGGQYV